MPLTKGHAKTRHHSNLRPKHKHTQKYLKHYWPYLPLIVFVSLGLFLLQPLQHKKGVLGSDTSLSTKELLTITNKQRQTDHQSPLAINQTLAKAAEAKAKDMVARNYWAHNAPNGDTPWVFITKAGYQYQKAGENLAYGFTSSSDVVAGWMNSPSHRNNILDASYREVGFGVAQSPNFNHAGPAIVVVAMYGQPIPQIAGVQTGPTIRNPLSTLGYNYTGQEPAPKSIAQVQAITAGRAPWSTYLVGVLIGAAFMYLILKHSLALKKVLAREEQFIIHHPLLDATLISLIILGFLITQQAGVIR